MLVFDKKNEYISAGPDRRLWQMRMPEVAGREPVGDQGPLSLTVFPS